MKMDSLPNTGGAVGLKQFHLSVLKAWERAREWNRFQWIDATGLLGLYLFSFGVLYRTLLVYEGLLLMAFAIALRIRTLGKRVLRDPLLILSAAFLVFLLIRTYFAAAEFKEQQSLVWEGMLKLFLFGFLVVFVVGYWMSRYPDRWNGFVLSLFIGHMVRAFRKFDWDNFYDKFDLIWEGWNRIGWGSTLNRFGLWNAIIFFGCVILCRQICGDRRKDNELIFWFRVLLWSMAAVLSGIGLVYSQSRSAWLAAVLVLPLVIYYHFYRLKRMRFKLSVVLGIVFLIITLTTNLPSVIEKRVLLPSNPFYNKYVKVSIEPRLLLYCLFWEKLKERPFFGFGPGTSKLVIEQSDEEYASVKMHNHFHNAVFDIMIQIGILGVLFYGLCFFLILRQHFISEKNTFKEAYFIFTFAALILMFICGLFSQPFADYKGVFLFGFIGSISYESKFCNVPEKSRLKSVSMNPR